jgi:16S rRNA (uracil1498-N3)-methyltransferase
MDYFYTPPAFITPHDVTIEGDEFAHLTHVMRKEPGDAIRVVDGLGTAYDVTLTEIRKRSAHGTIGAVLPHHGEPGIDVRLGVGVLKNPARFDFLVEKGTELGVRSIVPLTTERTITHHAKQDRWQKLALAAMKQCGRSYLPRVEELMELDAFLEMCGTTDERLIAHEKAPIDARPSISTTSRSIGLLVGPEGGFSDEEVERCLGAGFRQINLGVRRLRTETAVVAMLSRLGA